MIYDLLLLGYCILQYFWYPGTRVPVWPYHGIISSVSILTNQRQVHAMTQLAILQYIWWVRMLPVWWRMGGGCIAMDWWCLDRFCYVAIFNSRARQGHRTSQHCPKRRHQSHSNFLSGGEGDTMGQQPMITIAIVPVSVAWQQHICMLLQY